MNTDDIQSTHGSIESSRFQQRPLSKHISADPSFTKAMGGKLIRDWDHPMRHSQQSLPGIKRGSPISQSISTGSTSQSQNREQVTPSVLASTLQCGSSISHTQRPPTEVVSGHKRTVTGDIKLPSQSPTARDSGAIDTNRHRSQSIDSTLREDRIAALSLHLRTRLKYAASKIEKDWRSRDQNNPELRLLQNSMPPSLSPHGSRQPSPSYAEMAKGPSRLDNGSPEGTTVSAPDPYADHHSSNDLARMSPVARSDISPAYARPHSTPRTQPSPRKPFPIPILAPPVDIYSGTGMNGRRRPNPNEMLMRSYNNPSSRHRRHHSQQDFPLSKPLNPHNLLVPGTPPPSYPNSTLFNGSKERTHSENAAIETLLFLSSPGNSGYHPSPQREPNVIPNSIDGSIGTKSDATGSQTQSSHADSSNGRSISESDRAFGLEAQAGDDIDRMLDQMEDSESEDERRYKIKRGSSNTVPAGPGTSRA